MGKLKGKGVVLVGLMAGAVSFFRKKGNRDKMKDYFNQAKEKVNQNNGGIQGVLDKVQKVMDENTNGKMNDKNSTSNIQETIEKVMDENTNGKKDNFTNNIQQTIEKVMDENKNGKMNDKNNENKIQKTIEKVMDENTNEKMDDKNSTNKIQKTIEKVATTAATATESNIDGNQMVDEGGAQQTIDVYNKMQEEKHNNKRQQ